jgi:hypothetical protein
LRAFGVAVFEGAHFDPELVKAVEAALPGFVRIVTDDANR